MSPAYTYIETSAFNAFLQNLDRETFLGTRDLQQIKNRELLVSPVTLWELMLSQETEADFFVFSAQNFFFL